MDILKSIRWRSCVVWTGLAVLIFFIPVPRVATTPTDRTFYIEASRFQYTPGVLSVNPGDRVTIELTSMDVIHGLSIDGYNLSTVVDPGQTAYLTFIADRQGSFRFRCTVTCGNMHPFMIGKLEVGRNVLLIRAIGLIGLAAVAGIWQLKK